MRLRNGSNQNKAVSMDVHGVSRENGDARVLRLRASRRSRWRDARVDFAQCCRADVRAVWQCGHYFRHFGVHHRRTAASRRLASAEEIRAKREALGITHAQLAAAL